MKKFTGVNYGLLIVFLLLLLFPHPLQFQEPLDYYEGLFLRYGEKYGVDPGLIRAVGMVESRITPEIISPAGAIGELQVRPIALIHMKDLERVEIGEEEARELLMDSAKNVKYGTKYLAWCIEVSDGCILTGLATYNAGYGTIRRWIQAGINPKILEQIPYRETREYIEKVVEKWSL